MFNTNHFYITFSEPAFDFNKIFQYNVNITDEKSRRFPRKRLIK